MEAGWSGPLMAELSQSTKANPVFKIPGFIAVSPAPTF
jgi:hypothetical protein